MPPSHARLVFERMGGAETPAISRRAAPSEVGFLPFIAFLARSVVLLARAGRQRLFRIRFASSRLSSRFQIG
jgi:hypothetical protein